MQAPPALHLSAAESQVANRFEAGSRRPARIERRERSESLEFLQDRRQCPLSDDVTGRHRIEALSWGEKGLARIHAVISCNGVVQSRKRVDRKGPGAVFSRCSCEARQAQMRSVARAQLFELLEA